MNKLSGKNLFLILRRFTGLLLILAAILAAILVTLVICYSLYMVLARFICITLLKIVEFGESSFSSWI